jgi:uncharacterized membrane protein YdjX (TVP38/TMEM64 family)
MSQGRPVWRQAALAFVLFGGVGLMFLFGASVLGLSGPDAARHWLAAAHGPWGLPAAIVCFAVLAFLGVPQFVLIAAAVAAFGPALGMAYSWIGTLISALIGFWMGRAWGARLLPKVGEGTIGGFMALVARNGFIASLAIRLAPFAPFVVVNIAAGVTTIRLADFAAGTAIGILPKILLTGLAGGTLLGLTGGASSWWTVGFLVTAGAIWIGASFAARRWLKR